MWGGEKNYYVPESDHKGQIIVMQMVKRLLSKIINNDYLYSIVARILGVIFGVLLSILTARYFGPELKGVTAIIGNDISLYSSFLGLGIYIAYPFFKKQQGNIFRQYVNNISSLYFIYQSLAILVSVAAFIFKTNVLTVVAIVLLPISVYVKQLNYVVLIEHPKRRNTNAIFISLSEILVILSCALFFQPNRTIAIAYVCSIQIVNLILSFINLRYRPTSIQFDISQLGKYIKFGYVQMIVLVCMTINYNIDIQMLKHYSNVSLADIGIYGIGVALAQKIWLVPDAMKDILLSKLVKGKKEDEVARVIRINVWVALLCIILLVAIGRPLILLLYGQAFEKAYFVLLFMMMGVVGMIYYKMVYSYNISQGRQMVNLYFLGGAALVNTIGNFIAIPHMGIWGALISTIIAYNLCGLSFMVYFHKVACVPYKQLIFIQKQDLRDIKNYLGKSK